MLDHVEGAKNEDEEDDKGIKKKKLPEEEIIRLINERY